MENLYDAIIIGCGPSGMTCAIYLKRAGKNVLILEKSMPGGQMALTNNIENYPSIKQTDGASLSMSMFEQIGSLGVKTKFEEVISCNLESEIKTVKTHKSEYKCKTVYICTGASANKLNIENEQKLFGKGISYCATCDGSLYKDKVVAVVGAGNTALNDVVYLANIAKKVYLIHRRDEFRGDKVSVDRVMALSNNNVSLVLSSEIVKIKGNDTLESIVVKNKKDDNLQELKVDGLFIAIGRKPDTEIFAGVNIDEKGCIISSQNMQTNIKGVFAGGDVRNTQLRQIITACSDGAIAATSIIQYLSINNC